MATKPTPFKPTPLPKQYKDLYSEPGPRILLEALKTHGLQEKAGSEDNPTILWWAKQVGLDKLYKHDSTAWCGLALAYWASQAGFPPEFVNPLGARNWLQWGTPVLDQMLQPAPMLGDVLVYWRGSQSGWQGHVDLYVGEDDTHYHGIGGNKMDRVSITRIEKKRLLGARRCPWRINQPANVRKIIRSATGVVTTNEA